MTLSIFILRLGLAMVLGAAVGLERQWRQKSAGLRTNTLVSMGAAAFILLSVSLTDEMGDPSRVAGQIVTGIGFLGAGVIMKDGFNVQGLNTAATIWCSAAVGSLAGVGLYAESAITAAAIMFAHIAFRPLGLKLNSIPQNKPEEEGTYFYYLKIKCLDKVENHLRVLMLEIIKGHNNLQLRSLKSSDNGNPDHSFVQAQVLAYGRSDEIVERLAGKLTLEYGVLEVSWEVELQPREE
jgi:putative Mg2+ transporter-C (MgtC) family protein